MIIPSPSLQSYRSDYFEQDYLRLYYLTHPNDMISPTCHTPALKWIVAWLVSLTFVSILTYYLISREASEANQAAADQRTRRVAFSYLALDFIMRQAKQDREAARELFIARIRQVYLGADEAVYKTYRDLFVEGKMEELRKFSTECFHTVARQPLFTMSIAEFKELCEKEEKEGIQTCKDLFEKEEKAGIQTCKDLCEIEEENEGGQV